jgi:hypothetical protein
LAAPGGFLFALFITNETHALRMKPIGNQLLGGTEAAAIA